MRNIHTTIRRTGSEKVSSTRKTVYPPEGCLEPDFINEVEQDIKDVKEGKGKRYDSLDDLFSSYEQ